MKTTLNLNDELLVQAKAFAARRHTTLTRLIEEGLQIRLAETPPAPDARRIRLPVFKGKGGLAAGVDPLSNRSMHEALDDDA